MVRVKICGITNTSDALFAVREGADALGFIFAKSPRQVDGSTAKKIVSAAGPLVASIGVFVDESVERMLRLADHCGLSGIQLHGDEDARTVRKLQKNGFRVIKALRAGEGTDFKKLNEMPADAFLFDSSHAGKFGGTGQSFDWSYLEGLSVPVPWIVSGGLDPANVKKLLSVLKPYGVDVSSGVEKAPGKKNEKLVKEFIRNVTESRMSNRSFWL